MTDKKKGDGMMKRLIACVLAVGLLACWIAVSHAEVVFAEEASAAESGGCYLGIFKEGAPNNMRKIKNLEKETGKKFPIIMWYVDWSLPFQQDLCEKVTKRGSVPHIVWEPWLFSDRDKIKLDNIIKGEWDAYIKQWASDVAAWGKPVFVRWGHEFNIEGYPWCLVNNDKDPEKYIAAYRHVHDIFKKEGAKNAMWVWCPMREAWPMEPWNEMDLAYPGDEYVDWIGIDGYNWGTTQSWSNWQSFKALFRGVARNLSKKHPKKPIMIAEFASAEKGGDKAKWISEIAKELEKMPYIKSIIWFDERKETDWRTNSSDQSSAAFKKMMNHPYFASSSDGLGNASFAPAAGTKERAAAKYASKAPVIDGDLSDWANAAPILINKMSQVQEGPVLWKGASTLSGKIYIKWDKENFYLAANVVDSTPLLNKKKKKDIWNGDAIEIALGLDKSADPNRTAFGEGDFQIGFGAGDGNKIKPSVWNWTANRAPANKKIVVKKAGKPKGYTLEAMIPWSAIYDFVPSEGDVVGFNCALDGGNADEREIQMVWTGDYMFYKDPTVWGELEFVKN